MKKKPKHTRAPKKSPAARENSAAVERAASLFREFREDEPGQVTRVQLKMPRAAMVVGELEGVIYQTSHGGKREKYIHRFAQHARPLLLASSDGKQLLIVGGKFTFTDRGIVDARKVRR